MRRRNRSASHFSHLVSYNGCLAKLQVVAYGTYFTNGDLRRVFIPTNKSAKKLNKEIADINPIEKLCKTCYYDNVFQYLPTFNMTQESLSPIPYNPDRELKPSERRALTPSVGKNPTRYEVGALIPLTPEESRPILLWTNNAALAISDVGQVLATIPAETITSLEERQKTSSTENLTRNVQEKIRGFAFIAISIDTSLTESQNRRTDTEQERSNRQVAKTRPGQFLTGGQVKDALGRVSIARGEGLLFLPAHASDLNRRQLALLQTTRRVLDDHRDSNPDWAEDIQEGTILGLINQLEQTGVAIKNGYSTTDIESKISENARQTIKEELDEDMEASFTSLLQFSLLRGGKISALEKAGNALENCVVKDVYETDPTKTTKFLSAWLELFSRHAQGENARIIGTAYGDALATCVLMEQDNQDKSIFTDLSNVARKTALQPSGAELVLNRTINQSAQIQPNQNTLNLLSEIAERVQKRNAIDSIIVLIRFSVFTGDPKTTLNLLGRLSQKSISQTDRFHVVNGEVDLPFSVLAKLVADLAPEEWERVKAIIKQKGGSWEAKPRFGKEKNMIESVDLKDPEVIEGIKNSFELQVRRLIQGHDRLREKGFDTLALNYMYLNCSEEAKDQLTLELIQRIKISLPEAVTFVEVNMPKILKLASNKTLVIKARGFTSWNSTPDHQIIDPVRELGSSFSDKAITDQLATVVKIFDRLEKYREAIRLKGLKSSGPILEFKYNRLKKTFDAILTSQSQQNYEELRQKVFQLRELALAILDVRFH